MQEPANEPGLIGSLLIWGTAFVSWATGEAGRVIIAGAAGGFLRWTMQERRRFRDGIIQIGVGALCAHYLSPLVASLLGVFFGPIQDKSTTGFIAGLLGISLAKIIIAVFDARSKKLTEDRPDGRP